MEKPAYFVLGLKLVPSPERNLQTVIAEIDRKVNVWNRSQDLSQKAQVPPFEKLKVKLQSPNGYAVWDAEIENARKYAEERLNSLLEMFQASRLMTEAQLAYFKTHRELLTFYTPEEIERKILAQGLKVLYCQPQPLPIPTLPKPSQNSNAKRPLLVHAQLIEKNLKLLNRADLYELLVNPIAPEGELAMISCLGTADSTEAMQAASCDALCQRASEISQKLGSFRTKFAQVPAYNALNELCGLCSLIFKDENSKAGYDLHLRERPLMELMQGWEILALNPLLPRMQYAACIESVKKLGFLPNEAEWCVYEFFLSKGTKLEPAVKTREIPQPQTTPQAQKQPAPQTPQPKPWQTEPEAKQVTEPPTEPQTELPTEPKTASQDTPQTFDPETNGRSAGERLVKVANGVEYAFRWCPAGTFAMGSPDSEEGRYGSETQHRVTLTKGFWMLETQVTQRMWKSVTGHNPSEFNGTGFLSLGLIGTYDAGNYPVERVSWEDCQEFCRKLSRKIGMKISLPTEAQWEYACRAGTTGPFAGDLAEMGWYTDDSCSMTHPVGQKKPNAWGLYDMHGNVWEWCQDWLASYPNGKVTDPTGPQVGLKRVCRGGYWGNWGTSCRSARRFSSLPDVRGCDIGFRVIATDE